METLLTYARRLAAERHQGQTYAGTLPYTYHLDRVESIVSNWTDHCEPLVIAARLHDILEDTNTPAYEVEAMFGPHVAYVVHCVTDEPGENCEARFQKTAPKIQTSLDAQLVKLADRHANMQACVAPMEPHGPNHCHAASQVHPRSNDGTGLIARFSPGSPGRVNESA